MWVKTLISTVKFKLSLTDRMTSEEKLLWFFVCVLQLFLIISVVLCCWAGSFLPKAVGCSISLIVVRLKFLDSDHSVSIQQAPPAQPFVYCCWDWWLGCKSEGKMKHLWWKYYKPSKYVGKCCMTKRNQLVYHKFDEDLFCFMKIAFVCGLQISFLHAFAQMTNSHPIFQNKLQHMLLLIIEPLSQNLL